MKLYTDASADEEAEVFGIGYILDLKTGARIKGKHYVEGTYTSMEAEWYAIMQGLELAKENTTTHDSEIEVITDCQPLVAKIREPEDMYDDRWFNYRSQMLQELFTFDSWDLYWEKRSSTEQNEKANRLAREAMWEGRGDDGIVGGNASEGITFE